MCEGSSDCGEEERRALGNRARKAGLVRETSERLEVGLVLTGEHFTIVVVALFLKKKIYLCACVCVCYVYVGA